MFYAWGLPNDYRNDNRSSVHKELGSYQQQDTIYIRYRQMLSAIEISPAV